MYTAFELYKNIEFTSLRIEIKFYQTAINICKTGFQTAINLHSHTQVDKAQWNFVWKAVLVKNIIMQFKMVTLIPRTEHCTMPAHSLNKVLTTWAHQTIVNGKNIVQLKHRRFMLLITPNLWCTIIWIHVCENWFYFGFSMHSCK